MKIASGSADYLKRHWRGELPLWQAFWLSGVLPLCVPPVLTHVMPPEWLYNNAGNAGILALWIWQSFGILRSARRRRDGD